MPSNLRIARMEDAPALAAIYAPYVRDFAISFEDQAPDAAAFQARLREISSRYPCLVWETDDRVRGYAYAHRQYERAAYQWNAELSVYIRPEAQRQGLGGRLYGALLELLALQNVVNAYANVALLNPGSERLHRGLGFRELGVLRKTGYKCGAWRDVACFEKRLWPEDRAPEPFCPIQAVDRTRLNAVLAAYGGAR